MIIWGSRGISTTSDKGEFFCPRCKSHQPYKLKKIRKFFTLYFIPLIPLTKGDPYVECQSCKGTWYPDIVSYDQPNINPQLASDIIKCMRRLIATMILVDEKVLTSETDEAIEVYKSLTGTAFSRVDLNKEIDAVRKHPDQMWDYLMAIKDSLNHQGKEIFLQLILFIAISDNDIHETERELLESVAETLDITPNQLQQIENSFYELGRQ